MPRFTFPIPGRSKKQPPPPAPTQPVTKAHKILGSTYISIDSAKSWDNGSNNSGLSLSVSENRATASNGSGRAARAELGGPGRPNHLHRDWDDESDVVPHHIRINEPIEGDSDEDRSDRSQMLREQPSSSTIKSWYDKTKQPLSVTQQTSASAMAKGLPSKAQRLLDVDNAHPNQKARKKPSKLDLSRLKGDSRSRREGAGAMLGSEFITRSPSMISPQTPSSAGRPRQKLQKRATTENLRWQQYDDNNISPQPSSGGDRLSPRQPPNMSELPSLYKHYEQMSFAQVVGDDVESPIGEPLYEEPLLDLPDERQENAGATTRHELAHGQQPWPQRRRDNTTPDPLNSHPTHKPQSSPSPQLALVTTSVSHDQPSPTDCGASISSRHTRTSKASKHTEKSFQTADFIDKSVLMLSSDSEDDEDNNPYTELSAPGKQISLSSTVYRPASDIDLSSAFASGAHLQSSNTSINTEEMPNRQSGRTIRRTSTAPVGFLTIPSRFSTTSSPATSPSTESRASSHWGTTFHASSTPSLMSIASGSSGNTATSLQGAIEEARAVNVLPVQGRARSEKAKDDGGDSDLEHDEPSAVKRQNHSVQAPSTESEASTVSTSASTVPQATPPLSPSSVDFYIKNSHQSLEGFSKSQEHIMGLTRQEQMLITALRQRRESMRKTGNQKSDSQPKKYHVSKESEATITEDSFDFAFPIPPKSGKLTRKSSSVASSMIGLTIPGGRDGVNNSGHSVTADGTVFVLSPPPPSHHHAPKPTTKHISRGEARQPEHEDEHMFLYLDHPGGPALAIREGIMSPDTAEFANTGPSARISSTACLSPPHARSSIRRQRSNIDTSTKSTSTIALARDRHDTSAILEAELGPPFPPPTRELPTPPPRTSTPDNDAGVPRPDSPISPMANAFPGVPQKRRTINQQMARLSAFGPPKSTQPGWWGDED